MLIVDEISYAYPGSHSGKQVLEKVSFEVAPTDRLHIKAPSGSGKTTLCKLIAGYLKPDSGTVTVDGKPLPRVGKCPVQLIGQHPENMLDPRIRMQDSLKEAGPIDKQILDALGIQEQWMSRYPHELSGGEMQRFCIARALMAHPSYLIADEITTMLDALTQVNIWKSILNYCDTHEVGLIFTTHSDALASYISTSELALV